MAAIFDPEVVRNDRTEAKQGVGISVYNRFEHDIFRLTSRSDFSENQYC